MSDEAKSALTKAPTLVEHYCEHEDENGKRRPEWGCYGFEVGKGVTRWLCREHQLPNPYRPWPPQGGAQR